MRKIQFSGVEKSFLDETDFSGVRTNVPYITVENFPFLGLLTALRFIEWISENPEGVISLPTGKTPEYFIEWTGYLLKNWNSKKCRQIRDRHSLGKIKRPELNKIN